MQRFFRIADRSLFVAAILISGAMMVLPGCVSHNVDIREAMLQVARSSDKDFPDGHGALLTQFSYLGTLETENGIIRVVCCRYVLTGMPAPRGGSRIYFFSSQNALVGKISFATLGTPLLCEGSLLFFFGVQDDGRSRGNALDLSTGVAQAKFVFAERIGSWTRDGGNDEDALEG